MEEIKRINYEEKKEFESGDESTFLEHSTFLNLQTITNLNQGPKYFTFEFAFPSRV